MRTTFLAIGLILASGPATAQWITTKNENPFEGTEMHLAMTIEGGVGLGYRCFTKGDDPDILVLLPERGDRDTAISMTLLKPEIALIIDDEPKITLLSVADTVDVRGRTQLRFASVTNNATDVARKMAAAKRRIAVAVVIGGQAFHPTVMGTAGSRRSIDSVIGKCGAKPAS